MGRQGHEYHDQAYIQTGHAAPDHVLSPGHVLSADHDGQHDMLSCVIWSTGHTPLPYIHVHSQALFSHLVSGG